MKLFFLYFIIKATYKKKIITFIVILQIIFIFLLMICDFNDFLRLIIIFTRLNPNGWIRIYFDIIWSFYKTRLVALFAQKS